MLGEFKTDQLSVEESELPNKIFVENLNHISSLPKVVCSKQSQKQQKKTVVSNFNHSLMLEEF